METAFTVTIIIACAMFLRFLYESFREKNKQKLIAKAKNNVMEVLANHKEDCSLDEAMREIEAETELLFAADNYIRTIVIDSREAFELQQAVNNFKQYVLIS